ncbi:MAG: response regulator transcription factor [Candidatus Thiodiazotropha endolucinida]
MNPIRVLLVDDHAEVRAGYRTLLDGIPDIKVVAEAERGEEACQRFAELLPNVVVMDLSLPGIGGLEATRRIIARDSEAAILVFSMHDDTAFVEKALAISPRTAPPRSWSMQFARWPRARPSSIMNWHRIWPCAGLAEAGRYSIA